MNVTSSNLTLQDLEIAGKKLHEFALEVFAGNDESLKVKLLEGMKNLTKLQSTVAIKRPIEVVDLDSEASEAKRIKLKTVELPNEIWMKILNYLEPKVLFKNLALMNKHFRNLTLDPSAIKFLQVEDNAYNTKKKSKILFKNWMIVIKRSKALVELKIKANRKDLDWNRLIKETLKSNPCLKSLNVSFAIDNKGQISPEVMKFARNLQFFQSQNITFDQDFLNEMCKLKSLRKLIITKSYRSITPEFIEQLAFSQNPIEEIKICSMSVSGSSEKISKAFNTLYREKKSTMKSIDFICTLGVRYYHDGYCRKDGDHTICFPLPNFNMCKNITRINDVLHKHDLEMISDLPKLEELCLYGASITDATYLEAFHHMNFSSLKNLILTIHTNYARFIEELSKVQFPKLQRLSVTKSNFADDVDMPLSEKSLECLIRNIPTLTSIHLDCKFVSKIFPDFIFRMLRDEGVVIVLDSYFGGAVYPIHIGRYQKQMDKFFEMKGSTIHEKYQFMKNEFAQWWNSSKDRLGKFVY